MSRKLALTGRYQNADTYLLTRKDNGEAFLTIREGEEFTIRDRKWKAEKIPHKYIEGKTVILCKPVDGEKGGFVLPNHHTWSWHIFDAVEQILRDNDSVAQVTLEQDPINMDLAVGGTVKVGRLNYPYLYFVTDGQVERERRKKGCDLYGVHITGATYVIETFRSAISGEVNVKRVIMQEGGESACAKAIEEGISTRWANLKPAK